MKHSSDPAGPSWTDAVLRPFLLALVAIQGAWLVMLALRLAGHDHVFGLARLVDVDGERNLASWFSSLLLFAGGVAAWAASRAARPRERRNARAWGLLAAGFVVMSADEIAGLHESTGGFVNGLTHSFVVPTFAWVIPYGLLTLVLAAAFLPFLQRLPRRTAYGLLAAGALYVGGALGLEIVGGAYVNAHGTAGLQPATCRLIVTGEEFLEMLGAFLFLRTVLEHLAGHRQAATVAAPGTERRSVATAG